MQKNHSNRYYEPGTVLFQTLRNHLTLWYCGVLGASFIFFGISLYFGTQYALLNPIQSDVQKRAQAYAYQWLKQRPIPDFCQPPGSNINPLTDPGQVFPQPNLVACFDTNGSLLPPKNASQYPAAYLSNTLVASTLIYGYAEDTVDADGSIGPIYRYALAVQDPQGNGYIGVIVTGRSIKAEADALSSLFNLLLGIGGGALLCAGLGGLFLANRALVPARLAWSNQQRFLADASHELRTPLTLLRTDAEVLLRGRTRMQQEDISILEDILAETHHMTTITTNMLTLARLDSHQSHREHEVIDIAALTRRVMQRIHAFAEQRDITLEEQLTNNIQIIGDSNLIEQAILALLDNAVKYNKPNGKICVSTSIQYEAVHLKVHDTGIGVSTEHLPHLGERFYRVDKARSRQAGGTGLGLSIARSITVEHGGQLTLVSIPGQGTTATLVLPMARETPLAHKEA